MSSTKAMEQLLLKRIVPSPFQFRRVHLRGTILFLAAFSLASIQVVCAEWRGLVPLHSNCDDVKRVLGISKCDDVVTYETVAETAYLNFVAKPCLYGLEVPPGTLGSIFIVPKTKLSAVGLPFDLTTFRKSADGHIGDLSHYRNIERGLEVDIKEDGTVVGITYFGSAADDNLRVPGATSGEPSEGIDDGLVTMKFDEYTELSKEKEAARLKGFADQLQNDKVTQAYVLVYGGRHSKRADAITHADRVKKYLITECGIEGSRIITMDGGYKETLTVDLYISHGGGPPMKFPTLCPSEVEQDAMQKPGINASGRGGGYGI
jgi:hypothetical protein